MRLHEEYIQRHKLDIPVVLRDSRSTLFLKTKNAPYRWSIFGIVWRHKKHNPGFYQFSQMEPIRNGLGAFNSVDVNDVYWDQYETELFKIIDRYKGDGFFGVPKDHQILTAWEMFLYMYEDWLSRHMDFQFFRFVDQSTNTAFNLMMRFSAYENAVEMLSEHRNEVRDLEALLFNGHSQWLENLINEQETSQR